MIKKQILLFFSIVVFISCGRIAIDEKVLKNQILDTEREFEIAVKDIGAKEAFIQYAAEDAVLVRDNKLIKGKKAIANYFDNLLFTNISLEWQPDFVDIADSGDLGYTYGRYQFSAVDTTGNILETDGIFHTVWKKQIDGSWKYVYD